jgi:hypothetical protein
VERRLELDAEQRRVLYWLVQDGAECENKNPRRDNAQPTAATLASLKDLIDPRKEPVFDAEELGALSRLMILGAEYNQELGSALPSFGASSLYPAVIRQG